MIGIQLGFKGQLSYSVVSLCEEFEYGEMKVLCRPRAWEAYWWRRGLRQPTVLADVVRDSLRAVISPQDVENSCIQRWPRRFNLVRRRLPEHPTEPLEPIGMRDKALAQNFHSFHGAWDSILCREVFQQRQGVKRCRSLAIGSRPDHGARALPNPFRNVRIEMA